MALGADPLKAQVFKVPHHASKHGLNIELVERMAPNLCLISSTAGTGRYGFPHHLAVEAIREAQQPVVTSRAKRKPDHELGIHYTSAKDTKKRSLGSIALLVSPQKSSRLRMWRFGDQPTDPVDLKGAREFVKP